MTNGRYLRLLESSNILIFIYEDIFQNKEQHRSLETGKILVCEMQPLHYEY